MAANTKGARNAHPAQTHVKGWVREGIDSFMAAQKILLDLTAQQNALVLGIFRERLSEPFGPGVSIAKIADRGVKNFTAAGKILLDLAGDETELVVERVKEMVPLPEAAESVANILRHRLVTLLDLQKRFLEDTAELTHQTVESYGSGRGLMATGTSVAELARRGIQNLVETEKKFLDLAVHEVSAVKADGSGHKLTPERYKALTHLVRESGEKYVDAQQKLLNLAVEEMESAGKSVGRRAESVRTGTRTSWGEATEKSVQNFATAQKSLMNLVTKGPKAKASPAEPSAKTSRARPRTHKTGTPQREAA